MKLTKQHKIIIAVLVIAGIAYYMYVRKKKAPAFIPQAAAPVTANISVTSPSAPASGNPAIPASTVIQN